MEPQHDLIVHGTRSHIGRSGLHWSPLPMLSPGVIPQCLSLHAVFSQSPVNSSRHTRLRLCLFRPFTTPGLLLWWCGGQDHSLFVLAFKAASRAGITCQQNLRGSHPPVASSFFHLRQHMARTTRHRDDVYLPSQHLTPALLLLFSSNAVTLHLQTPRRKCLILSPP